MIQSLAVKALARQAAASIAGSSLRSHASRTFATTSGFPPPRLFDYETVTSNLTVSDAIGSVEEAFKALAKGKVDVPMPMHIGIEESSVAGPGDCHIKGGCKYCYIINYIHIMYIVYINLIIAIKHTIRRRFGNTNLHCQASVCIFLQECRKEPTTRFRYIHCC